MASRPRQRVARQRLEGLHGHAERQPAAVLAGGSLRTSTRPTSDKPDDSPSG